MREAFSFNREFDFVRLDGLRRATGRPPHEWDLYIVKELIDNALDADETLWREDPAQFPRVYIRMEYIPVPERRSQQLFVQVSNRAMFPVEQMADIFATQWYTSRKAFIKGLTRGALGNALKTLLGIPYALRNRVANDWSPELKPMSILCNGVEYLPRYTVDSTAQTICFEYAEEAGKLVDGTVVSVGLDHFEQEMPRTLAQVAQLAEQYHLCNPHVEFYWTVEIEGQEWTKEYGANPDWESKFQGIAPVQWYSPTAFQDLLGALYRQTGGSQLPLETVCSCFDGPHGEGTGISQGQLSFATVAKAIGKDSLTVADIEGQVATRLYQMLCKHSPRFDSARLGCIGSEHIREVLSRTLPIDGDILYDMATDTGDDPNVPFVIEAAMARLNSQGLDGKRQIWTALNFAPTYGDPFLNRWLRAPIQPDEPVLGLRGLLDAYGLRDEEPVILFLHLVCPNVEHSEFSKTEINHLPFKQVLGELLDRLFTDLRQAREDEERRLEQAVFRALDTIVAELDPEERFASGQLLERLRARLSRDTNLAAWLETPDALSRLQAYIASYRSRNAVLTTHVARPAPGMLSIPSHPDRHYSVLVEDSSRELLARHHVNKVLYVQVPELEPVIIENNWLCRMDMALLRNPPNLGTLQDAVLKCMVGSDLPILTLHNADEEGRIVMEQMLRWLEERDMNTARIVDLGLDSAGGLDDDSQLTRLVEMMPGELAVWLLARFEALGLPLKSAPADADIRSDISKQFERLLLGHLWEGMSQQIEVVHLLSDLDKRLYFTEAMKDQALDDRLKSHLKQETCTESYAMILDRVVGEFFEGFMHEHGANIQELAQAHLARVRNGWKR
jgi:hypothetical protein